MPLPQLDEPARSRAEQRLRTEDIIWLTTVRADGQPQASPVGFLWNGEHVLILSQPSAPKVANLRANPRVALHLDVDREADEGILTLEGVAALGPPGLGEGERAAYLDKYREDIQAQGLTPDEVLATYSTVIRVTPTRVRTY